MPYKDSKVRKAYHKKYSRKWERAHKRWLTPEYRKKRKDKYVPSERMKAARRHYYGMSHEEYEKRVKKQKNRCALCGRREHLINPYTGKRQSLAVDHDHKTNQVRALLCGDCNRALGLFRENLILLRRAIRYLQKYKGNNQCPKNAEF